MLPPIGVGAAVRVGVMVAVGGMGVNVDVGTAVSVGTTVAMGAHEIRIIVTSRIVTMFLIFIHSLLCKLDIHWFGLTVGVCHVENLV